MSALAGRRIVITRPRPAAEELARSLTERGAAPLVFPTVVIRSEDAGALLRAAVDQLAAGDWVVLTSANAGELAAPYLAGLAGGGVRLAAIGAATASALTRHGLAVDRIPSRPEGAVIADALGDLHGRRVLVPRSASGRDETLAGLEVAGAVVHAIPLYRVEREAPDPSALEALARGFDAIVFTSPSTVRGFLELAGPGALESLRASAVVCIGPTTAGEARAVGVAHPIVAEQASADGILSALEHHFALAPSAPGRDP